MVYMKISSFSQLLLMQKYLNLLVRMDIDIEILAKCWRDLVEDTECVKEN